MAATSTPGASLWAGGGWLVRAVPGLWPAFVVVALLACVLVPLPTRVVDLLLSASLAGSVLLVVASLRVARTTDFLVFPSLLLSLTLFRLALNVSTTRLILSQADAGRVIDAFAGFVVRGDFVVGAVIFAIITLIQYLVVARGAERVAEVGARFELDALPGHQAAIDADLRAGTITPREAAARRAALIERSRFHGAMDGAIRFVRGDVTAGLVITAVNLAGGLWIGTVRRGLDLSSSLDIYGRLTIGDGLLAQIPAVLVSVAAGILVARIDREVEDGPKVASWLDPAMLVVPAALLLGLAAVPAMPSLAFGSTAAVLLATAFAFARRRADQERARPRKVARSIRVLLGPDVPGGDDLAVSVAALRGRLVRDLGLPVPPVRAEPAPATRGVRVVFGGMTFAASQSPADGPDGVVVWLYRVLLRHADHLVDRGTVEALLAEVRETDPALAREAAARLSTAEWVVLLRAFARERVPLPPTAEVLAAVVTEPRITPGGDRGAIVAWVRRALAPAFVPTLLEALGRNAAITWVRTTPDLEADLAARHRPGPGLGELALSRGPLAALRGQVRAVQAEGPVVVVASDEARPAVALALCDRMGPFVPVLATGELDEAGIEPPKARAHLDTWRAGP